MDAHHEHGEPAAEPSGRGPAAHAAALPAGLSLADAGRRILAGPTIVEEGRTVELWFRIMAADGRSMTSFDELHERRMHLIVVRRDLTGFQHLHPHMDPDGTWRTPVTLGTAGAWRAFADHAADGIPATLGVDVLVGGEFHPQPLPDSSTSAVTSAHQVTLERRPDGVHRFTVVADGTTVRPEPYLGALGHLVVLRWGDLAFLHVHPVSRDDLVFQVDYPTPGAYRCFLQYVVHGEVSTVAFTSVV